MSTVLQGNQQLLETRLQALFIAEESLSLRLDVARQLVADCRLCRSR